MQTDFDELKSTFKKYGNHANKKYNKVVRERHDLAKKLDITKEKAKTLVAAGKRLGKKKVGIK